MRAARATAMATAMRLADDEEGKGSKAMVMARRIAGKWSATVTKRVMVIVTRVADGEKEGDDD